MILSDFSIYILISMIMLTLCMNLLKTALVSYRRNRDFIRDFQDYKIVAALLSDSFNSSNLYIENTDNSLTTDKDMIEGKYILRKQYKLCMYLESLVIEITSSSNKRRMIVSERVKEIKITRESNIIKLTLIYENYIGQVCLLIR